MAQELLCSTLSKFLPKAYKTRGGDFKMKAILAAMFAVMIGLVLAGSTFADEPKNAPMGAPPAETMKKSETKSETTTENKNGKKSKKTKKTTKTEEKEKVK
jgi:sugar phosphate permease